MPHRWLSRDHVRRVRTYKNITYVLVHVKVQIKSEMTEMTNAINQHGAHGGQLPLHSNGLDSGGVLLSFPDESCLLQDGSLGFWGHLVGGYPLVLQFNRQGLWRLVVVAGVPTLGMAGLATHQDVFVAGASQWGQTGSSPYQRCRLIGDGKTSYDRQPFKDMRL